MERLEANRDLWPEALRKAETDFSEKMGGATDGFLWIEARDFTSFNTGEKAGTRFIVLWQANKTAPRYNFGPIDITVEQFTEYREWFELKMAGKRAADRQALTEKLLAQGIYKRRSTGLLTAVKIDSILAAVGTDISLREIVAIDEEIYSDSTTQASFKELRRLPLLSDDSGEPKDSTRQALTRLYAAGLVEHHGGTKNRTYSLID